MANRLKNMVFDFVSLVPRGANQHADVVLAKRDDSEYLTKREFSSNKREAMAEKGTAMPDGSFPIANKNDLSNAIKACGRSKNPDVAKKHIIKRAKALNMEDMIPEEWTGEVEKTDPSGDSVHVDTPMGSKSKKRPASKDEQDTEEMGEEANDSEEEEMPAPKSKSKRKMNKGVDTTDEWESSTLTDMEDNTGLPEGLTPEAIEYIEKLEDLVIAKDDEINNLLSDPDVESKEDYVYEDDLEEVAKSDPTVAALLAKYEAAESRALEAETIAKAERDARITNEMVVKAQGYESIAPVNEMADILKSLHEIDSDLFNAVDGIFAKAASTVAESNLFTEIGKSSDSTVGADLDAVAKSLRADDPSLTAAQAVAKALEARPDLYNLGGNR
ncbi:hypothetical protein UFOVP238_59 [uncultured Caudovirales phage]|uniref:Uncharacterized protein n=1 Tax=uncultured Caudovirales phage TaxID=2100421 RepID=A0A6J7WWE4_9CAUD|nr:hypothetical protein UFOVP238_59 [uncultured Caudovirales phage]